MTLQLIRSVPNQPPPIVLLVEDDVDTRDMYHTALEFGGFWVVDAFDAAQAAANALDLQPDLIVTDLGLPGRHDGLGLARELKGNVKTARIPLIAVTGRDPRTLGSDAALFDEVLLKPVLPDELIRRIQQTLAHSAMLRERSAAARSRVPQLLQRAERVLAKSQRTFARRAVALLARSCPRCGEQLRWSERRKMLGVTFDYYHACANGCGLYCYNHSDQAFVPLTE